jgi:hypothetical protein
MLPGKKKTGRPRAIGPAELATLRPLVDDGVSVTEAARTLKIGRSTAYEALAKREIDQHRDLLGRGLSTFVAIGASVDEEAPVEVLSGLAEDLRAEFLLIEALHAEAERLVGEEARTSGVHPSRPGGYWYA